MTLTRSDVVAQLAAEADLPVAVATRVLATVEQLLVSAARRGETVRLTGTLTMQVAERPARTGRNPRTGESLEIPATMTVRLAPGATLKAAAKASAA